MNTQPLQQIGLSLKESRVYEIMLRLGEVPIGDLIKETGDHPQIIYRAIDGLEGKGLAITATKKHRKYVRAENPQKLAEIEKNRLDEINKIIPSLEALQKTPKEVVIRVNKGDDAVRRFRSECYADLPEGDVLYVIVASADYYFKAMEGYTKQSENERIKKKIKKKLIGYRYQKEEINSHEYQMELAEHRYLSENYPTTSSTNIAGNKVGIIIWEPETIVITIESQQVADNYRNYFDILWKIAKP